MLPIYLFALVLGGILLLGSLVGGHDSGGDTAAGDFDGDLDADADVHDVDGPPDTGHHGDLAGVATLFLSLRFWTFFSTFFGLTGVTLRGLGLLPSGTATLGLALATGGVCGLAAAWTFRHLGTEEVGGVAGVADFVGKTGRVLVPISSDGVGKVRLGIGGTTVDVLAFTRDETTLSTGETVLVVSMSGTRALVTGLGDVATPS